MSLWTGESRVSWASARQRKNPTQDGKSRGHSTGSSTTDETTAAIVSWPRKLLQEVCAQLRGNSSPAY